MQIHHVSLIVAETQRALAFYVGVLGLQQADRPSMAYDGAWLQVGAQQIHLLALPNPDPTSDRPEHGGRDRHLALAVTDWAGVVARLEAGGVELTHSQSGRQAVFCRDPDGNALELIAA